MLIDLLRRLRGAHRRWRIWRRRRKLISAYAKVGRIRHGFGPGFTANIYAYGRLEEDGLATVTEDGLVWHWPAEDEEVTA